VSASGYQVAIPSHNRAPLLARKTLPMLAHGGVAATAVTVFVATEDEAAQYKQVLPADQYRTIVVTRGDGISGQRNAIMRHYPIGTQLVQVDDDVAKLQALQPGTPARLAPITDVDGFIRTAFIRVRKVGAVLWGVYPAPNAGFMHHRLRVGLAFIIGTFFGTTVRHITCEVATVPVKEDYEASVRYFLRDGRVARFEDVTLATYYAKTPGGLQGIRTTAMEAGAVFELRRRYPQLVHLNPRRRSGLPEIILRDKRPA
jgi:hypothetical protein